jgi:DNA-binding transcriptional ArsR family regulator
MATEHSSTLIVGCDAREMRRRLGPTSWVVLEEILQRAEVDGRVARVSIRTLAASLGLAKDTVARAVRRLRDAGLLDAVQERASTGIFETGTYRVTIDAACLTITDTVTIRRTATTNTSNTPLPRHQSEQLELTLDT